MLIPSSYKGIYEKVLRAPDGRLVRVQFAVVEVNGALRGRIISMEPIEDRLKIEDSRLKNKATILYLPSKGNDYEPIFNFQFSIFNSLVSPYTTLDFFMSQPTRAPSSK